MGPERRLTLTVHGPAPNKTLNRTRDKAARRLAPYYRMSRKVPLLADSGRINR
jgi:hypothetical protein